MVIFLTDGTGRWFDTAQAQQAESISWPGTGMIARTKTGAFVLALERATQDERRTKWARVVEIAAPDLVEILVNNGLAVPSALVPAGKEI